MKKSLIAITGIFLIAIAVGCDPPDQGDNGCGGPGECTELQQYGFMDAAPAVGGPPSGPYEVVIEGDPNFPNHTIFRPVGADDMPVLAWGEGGCVKAGRAYAEMMSEIASYGILIIADGAPEGGGKSPGTMMNPVGDALTQGITYAFEKNDDPCSPLYQKVDTGKVAVSGQSCGGLLAARAAADPRVTTTLIMSSGLFQDNQTVYEGFHTPILYMNGGPTDVAYANAETDIAALDKMDTVPIYWANLGIGHMADILEDGGGEFGRVMTGWLMYQFWGDPESTALFEGEDCGLCIDDDPASQQWTLQKYNGAP